jgi:hypothetical protein
VARLWHCLRGGLRRSGCRVCHVLACVRLVCALPGAPRFARSGEQCLSPNTVQSALTLMFSWYVARPCDHQGWQKRSHGCAPLRLHVLPWVSCALLSRGSCWRDLFPPPARPLFCRAVVCVCAPGASGMNDYSGEWSIRVGVPAKSGVSGVIMIVIPHVSSCRGGGWVRRWGQGGAGQGVCVGGGGNGCSVVGGHARFWDAL